MFGYSMVQTVRMNAHKLDRPLRDKVLNMYKPFKMTPCFLHKMFEGFLKKTKKLPVIIEFEKENYQIGCHEVHQVLDSSSRCKVKKEFSTVPCCSAVVTPAGLDEILNNCKSVKKIYLNREVKALLDTAVGSANARSIVRNNTTLTGKNVTVAVIDTGVYPHLDLSGRIIDFVDLVNQRQEIYDDNGHGTHCAGDIAGNGAASSGRYVGPAPEANIVGVKVLDKMGSGSLDTVMQGVEWCIQQNESNPNYKIDIISMSLGSTAQRMAGEDSDPMVQMVEEAWARGIVVCVAAGNEGPEPETIASPGISNKVITVGAYDDRETEARSDDDVASFSSRGPTVYGVAKPDLLAPGVNIVSLRSPDSFIDKLQKSSRVDTEYFSMSGTSMATPICAGIVALMLEYNPNYSPDDIKTLLKQGVVLPPSLQELDPNVYGAGFINADNSIPVRP
ncbi:serine protease AprX [Bacillus carboniphilus]|uniref:Serine protease AprX n=1 Tax=Bacillus carboniphilus TaxID=86663 RepID=A0ABP3G5D5_9BACI